MAGHRDDGTFAEDKAHHEGRKVSRDAFMSGPPAGWTMNNMVKGLVGNSDEVLDPWDPEDIQEEQTLKEERLKKGHY